MQTETSKPSPPLIDHTVNTIDGKSKSLTDYRGKALLIVNTASECGLTPQYADLEALYLEYKDRGFEVLGFPSNNFGGQEPGTCEQIQTFVSEKYKITFPMFDKVEAKGPQLSPLYKSLTQDTAKALQGEISWNFTKFLVDPRGAVVARFEPKVSPTSAEVKRAIEGVLP